MLGRGPALLPRVPCERVPRAVQDVPAPRTHRHDGRQDWGIEARRRQSREKFAIDGDGAYLRVGAAEVYGIGTDAGLVTVHRVLDTGGRPVEGHHRFRTEDETGESQAIHRKAIAREVVPGGVGLQRRSRLLDRRWRRFGNGGRARAQSVHEKADRKAYREEEQETISGHTRMVCDRNRFRDCA